MEKIYTRQVDSITRKLLFDLGYFGEKVEVTGKTPEGKRDYYKRTGWNFSESGADKVDVRVGDVLDWLRTAKNKHISVDPYRDVEGNFMYCGKIVDIMTCSGEITYASESFDSALGMAIIEALKSLK